MMYKEIFSGFMWKLFSSLGNFTTKLSPVLRRSFNFTRRRFNSTAPPSLIIDFKILLEKDFSSFKKWRTDWPALFSAIFHSIYLPSLYFHIFFRNKRIMIWILKWKLKETIKSYLFFSNTTFYRLYVCIVLCKMINRNQKTPIYHWLP